MDNDTYKLFGLTKEQIRCLFSIEYLITDIDAQDERDTKKREIKKQWLREWRTTTNRLFDGDFIINRKDLVSEFKSELEKSADQTWYNLVILEAVTFSPYTMLQDSYGKTDKEYAKLKYKPNIALVADIISEVGVGDPASANRYYDYYKKAIAKGEGRTRKIITDVLIVALGSAAVAATAGALAPALAVTILGSEYAGLSGIALTNACLAAIAGGAVAAGGGGIAGGIAMIVGGGALIGGVGTTACVAASNAIIKMSPKVALIQGAKLDVVVREIILNKQKDIVSAQKVLAGLKEKVGELNKELEELKLENKADKKEIENMKEAIKYLENIVKDLNVFTSSFQEGMKTKK